MAHRKIFIRKALEGRLRILQPQIQYGLLADLSKLDQWDGMR